MSVTKKPLEEFVAYLVKNLVANPDQVNVFSKEEDGVLLLEIACAQDDIGKVIGRKGNTISSLRTIVRTVGVRLGKRVELELHQEGGARRKFKQEEVPTSVS